MAVKLDDDEKEQVSSVAHANDEADAPPVAPVSVDVQPENSVTVVLQPRHFDWLKRSARMYGRTVEHHLEWLVRQAYAADATKAGTINAPTVPAVDFKP